jgi:hypothetical protein
MLAEKTRAYGVGTMGTVNKSKFSDVYEFLSLFVIILQCIVKQKGTEFRFFNSVWQSAQ